ncbi:hypothetical protein BV372_31695 [Nostoc sp. T09]|uniref:GUN4 domain-containing protein n=1 Tax=Nostoc sp. T09 TaxID=1932621 RepID=UPI000A3D224E|nr:GUN4 domain-containing protein [Nostoc sp. T09]OUL21505.1 hypothetical protein BV372_31695 [Nostoc sp. T09]
MPDNTKQPREYDAVLGGQAPPPIDGLVLGGIEGVKHRLDSNSQESRIAALSDALKYGKEGQELLNQIFLTETGLLQWVAYDLLFQSATEDEKQNLLQHIPLQSEVGADYSSLRNLLASGEWLQANLETREKIQEAVGSKNQYYYHMYDLHNLSQTDLRTIDQLWVKFSNNHFGFSIQKRILLEEGCQFYKNKFHLRSFYNPNYRHNINNIYDTYKKLGWPLAILKASQFSFNSSAIGSLPSMITEKQVRHALDYQIVLIYRSDL